ncbi:MAG TPA: ribonuclease HII [Candidatus Lokiarchaeia archaeon]|nr:ribonuclease HII [Candidatus Lokiarchaeia archaeon]
MDSLDQLLVSGADEAGRGPVLGPLVICAACFLESDITLLKERGVTDSKKLTAKRREELVDVILEKAVDHEIVVFSAQEIVESMQSGVNLNQLEVEGFARAINAMLARGISPRITWIDAADVIAERFGEHIQAKLDCQLPLLSMHKADAIHIPVGAASILAKTKRDALIEELASKYGNIGSGYPSDPVTRNFLKDYYLQHGCYPPITRTTWDTLRKLEKELGILPKGQTTLF